eukprot:4074959-Pleurochrysis_carterae.AAC.1
MTRGHAHAFTERASPPGGGAECDWGASMWLRMTMDDDAAPTQLLALEDLLARFELADEWLEGRPAEGAAAQRARRLCAQCAWCRRTQAP